MVEKGLIFAHRFLLRPYLFSREYCDAYPNPGNAVKRCELSDVHEVMGNAFRENFRRFFTGEIHSGSSLPGPHSAEAAWQIRSHGPASASAHLAKFWPDDAIVRTALSQQ